MQYIDERLKKYAKSDVYPFHMPGHKRQMKPMMNPYEIDITEIDGFDNLHNAQGIIKEAQERAAKLWGAKHTHFLVNGSTCGILSAISAAVKKHGTILMARNCHKAAYHAAYLRELNISYLYPVFTEYGIQGLIPPEDVREELKKNPEIEAVIVTSPTYDGITSDINAIAKIAHEYSVPLIVDEAHGAHFGFHSYFPESAITQGADIVIQSMHKTLPSFTMTALLHTNSTRISEIEIENFLDIYETSSPSYLLMAGMDRCVRLLVEQSGLLFENYAQQLEKFYKKSAQFKQVKVLDAKKIPKNQCFAADPSKLVISAENIGLTGQDLYNLLLKKYHLQMEMSSGNYVLAMTSFMDSEEGYTRLYAALQKIDRQKALPDGINTSDFIRRVYHKNLSIGGIPIYEAVELAKERRSIEKSKGEIAGDYIYLYPPGIPLVVPGEVITEEVVQALKECMKLKLNMQGVECERINIVNFNRIQYTRGEIQK